MTTLVLGPRPPELKALLERRRQAGVDRLDEVWQGVLHMVPAPGLEHADNWRALIEIGEQTNQRLLDAQLQACQCAPDPAALARIVLPSTHDGQPAPGLRFGDPRVMALLACLCPYGHLFGGLTNRSLRELIAGLIDGYTARQATYDLRRVRRKGLIRRVPRTQRYELTDEGRRIAVFFSKTYTRIVNPSLAGLDPQLPNEIARSSALARARDFDRALEDRIEQAAIAASKNDLFAQTFTT